MIYDADDNTFLPGNHITLFERATQCLTSFSLDFERISANKGGPDMALNSVFVDGSPARFSFAQPTYPGDPKGLGDPDPRAHEASETDPVGGPLHNPFPPACTPELTSQSPSERFSLDGTQCPADKLVITPRKPLSAGLAFTVDVYYSGHPGLHYDGDGTNEGWYRTPDGGFVESEPVGTEDWMPLNNYPTAKPTYDFFDTIGLGETAIANGMLVGLTHNANDAEFPNGSITWHWRSVAPIASYLVEDSVGDFSLRTRVVDGLPFYEVQDRNIPLALRDKNFAIVAQQPAITKFEAGFLGAAFPFTSDGVAVTTAPIDSAEEMQTMIVFGNSHLGLDTLWHENMHQWWGDNVTEGGYAMTFFKEGMATVGQYLLPAKEAEDAAGGSQTAAGRAAFNAVLVRFFNQTYDTAREQFWTIAPSKPSAFTLFGDAPTYARPAAAYLALRQILGPTDFTGALDQIQDQFGGSSITEPQLEASFAQHMPNRTNACLARLAQFFTQWFDTGYPAGGGTNRPQLTGPGLAGPGFYSQNGVCD
jgi:hypothetical protein